MWTPARRQSRIVDLTSAGPARLCNIACKGRTPHDGVGVTGWPVGTFVRGKRVMWQGELTAASTGEPVRFLETLRA
jgi:dihydroorotase